MNDVCNYADDTAFNVCDLDIKSLIIRLVNHAALALKRF